MSIILLIGDLGLRYGSGGKENLYRGNRQPNIFVPFGHRPQPLY